LITPYTSFESAVTGAISLSDGHWQGEPWVAQGDLDYDGRTESVNLVNYSTGGTGHSACNRYFAGVSAAGDVAGGIEVAAIGGTRMACQITHLLLT
jgi:heat shock protein HslJ